MDLSKKLIFRIFPSPEDDFPEFHQFRNITYNPPSSLPLKMDLHMLTFFREFTFRE
jgi:hypothetical protein